MAEKYLELYKKYRPRGWKDVVGQDNAVKQLKEIIKQKRLPTAFSFSGKPGTGKTTLASIIAKTLNCPNVSEDLEPCNDCSICKGIDNNSLMGYQYFSMANDGGVDKVREIMNDAMTSAPITKKVIIVDEYHNASSPAMDALLIPLESEKMNTLFIFCTTELDKIKPAVLSRVQSISLSPVGYKPLAELLVKISKLENISVTKEIIMNCVEEAGGSVRNAISRLEAFRNGAQISDSLIDKALKNIIIGDPVELINTINEMQTNGENFTRNIEKLYASFTSALQEASGVSTSNKIAKVIAEKWTGSMILKAIDDLSSAVMSFNNRNIDTRLLFEIPAIKLALMAKSQGIK